MATGLVVHIGSGANRSTEVLTQERIRIGASADCELQLPSDGSPAANAPGPIIELARHNGSYRVASYDSALKITHNGRAITSDGAIRDGDEIRVDPSGVLLTFFPVEAQQPALVPGNRRATHVAPFIEQAGLESAATARRDDAKIFLREFTRELVREIRPGTKIVTLAIALILVGGVLYIGFALFSEVRRSRGIIVDQGGQMRAMNEQVSKANETLSALGRSNKEIRDSLSLAVKLRSDYGAGVCLIAGSYVFVEAGTGRVLRYAETQMNESGAAVQSSNEQSLTPDGKGAVAEFEFVGTGFLVGEGFVLTNRHVAQPWLGDDRAQSLGSSVRGQPRLKKLIAFFPDQAKPVVLKFKQAAQREDLAVCTFDLKDVIVEIPVLPLEKESGTVEVGKTVVMMGYPLGPDRLLALLDEDEARAIQARYGGSLESLLGHLSETKHIQPLTTQGNITDLEARRIVYDARTAEGGSGGPLFGPSGRVIGVNFAVLTGNTASNFAVPVRYAIALLQRAGWTQPEGMAGEQNENSNVSQANSRSATGSATGSANSSR